MPVFESIEEMIERSNWSGKDFTLNGPAEALWRTNSTRDPVLIEEQEDFRIDGGELGITIYGTGFNLKNCRNVKLKNLTIRMGAKDVTPDIRGEWKRGYNGEALRLFDGCRDVEIENCTFSWGLDETLSIVDSKDVKVSDTIVCYPLFNPRNFQGTPLWEEGEDDHAYAAHTPGSKSVSYRRCVFAHANRRSPQFAADGRHETDCEVRHSIIYNFSEDGTTFNANANGDFQLDIHDNYYVPNSSNAVPILIEGPKKGEIDVKYKRNVCASQAQFRRREWVDVKPEKEKNKDRIDLENEGDGTPRTSFEDILTGAGPEGIQPPYTQSTKSDIRAGIFPPLLCPHEPEDFQG